jgi:LysM repeat protein
MNEKTLIRLALLLAFILGWTWGSRPEPAAAQGGAAQALQLVNGVRAEYGLTPFTYNPQLAAAAQQQANWMAATALYLHNHGGSTPQTRAAAAGYGGAVSENIVGGTDLTPRQGVIWWRNSAIHFNTMISTRYTEAGTAVAQGNDQTFYVLVVGNPSGGPPPSAQAAQPESAPAYVAPIVLAKPGEDGSIVHTVGEGHTLWAIAARYEVPLDRLLLYNNLSEDAYLQPGDQLLIQLAEGQEPPPTPTPPATHVVREGETAWTIAARYRLSLDEILWLNGLSENEFLQPGDEVVIRLLPGQTPPPTPTPQLTHIVRSGETLWEIALSYNLTLEQLLAWNGLAQNDMIREGQELYIRPPATAVPSPPTSTPPPATTTATPSLEETAVSPSLTPTFTPLPALAAAGTPSLSPTLPPPAPSSPAGPNLPLLLAAILAGVGVTALAAAAVIAIRRQP